MRQKPFPKLTDKELALFYEFVSGTTETDDESLSDLADKLSQWAITEIDQRNRRLNRNVCHSFEK